MTFEAQETSRDLGKPFQLFKFISGPTEYRYTSTDTTINYAAEDYLPDNPMNSASIKETNVDDRGKLNFEVMSDHALANLFKVVNPRTITLTILEGHQDDPDDEVIVVWNGRVVACEWGEDGNATISCESVITILSRGGLPYKFGTTCQHTLYRGGCGLSLLANSTLETVTGISGNDIIFTSLIGASTEDYKGGLIVVDGVDHRMISDFDGATGTATLLRPFEDLELSDLVRVANGCDRTSVRCKALLNFDNFLGFETVPTRNPFDGLRQAGIKVGDS